MLEQAISSVQRTLREHISADNSDNAYVYTKILTQLVNSWVEVRLMKLIYEFNAFDDDEKAKIIATESLEKRWIKALNISFCKKFKVSKPSQITTQTAVPYSAKTRYEALLKIIKSDLLESSSLRNKIAHGQWKFVFNTGLLKINGQLTAKLKKENILTIQFRLAIFKSLAQIIHDLAVSKPTFDRDFDANYKKILEQRRNAQTRARPQHQQLSKVAQQEESPPMGYFRFEV